MSSMLRDLNRFNKYRQRKSEIAFYGEVGDGTCGMFIMPSPIDNAALKIIASGGDGWDHVSVSRSNRCPNWPEMEHVKRLFFDDAATVMQLHVPASEHINAHPHCLHLWRPHDADIPRPPGIMVGPMVKEDIA